MSKEARIEAIDLDNMAYASGELRNMVSDGWEIVSTHLDGAGDEARLIVVLQRDVQETEQGKPANIIDDTETTTNRT
jgi:hypothetical protein